MTAFPKLVLLVIHVLLCWVFLNASRGDEPVSTISEIEKYETQINYMIRSRLDAEKDYVHQVVDLVRRGKLPRKLVDNAAFYVYDNCSDDNFGFVYFEQVLRRQSSRLGFKVPRFDYHVYDSSNASTNR